MDDCTVLITLCFVDLRSRFCSSFVLFYLLPSSFVASSLLMLQVALRLRVSWATSISWMDRGCATAALQQKEGRGYYLSKNHRNTSLESIWYHTTSSKTHTKTHILIFNPGEFARCNFSSVWVYALYYRVRPGIWFSAISLTSPAAEALYQSTES